jgi:very-short-patch-repair endonuclease
MALLAGGQHGVVSRWQLLELGMSRDRIQDRAARSQLHRLYRGVYAVGHRKLTLKGVWMAAVLACGPDAALSHRAGLGLWDVRRTESGLIDVTMPGRTGRRGPDDVRLHRSTLLREADVDAVDGIPVTSLAWTVVDYAGIAHRQQLRSVLEALERRGLYIGRELDELLERAPNRKGVKAVTAVIAEMTGPAPWLQSELEAIFREVIRGSDLPDYEANVMVEGEVVDALWRKERVIVELDGYAFHKSRARFEADRRRDAKLQVAGYRVLRVTQERLTNEPQAVLAEIRALLSAARAASAAAGR